MATTSKRLRAPGPGYEGDPTGRSPWLRPGFIASGVLVAALIVVALVLLLTSPGDPQATPSPPSAPSAPPTIDDVGPTSQPALTTTPEQAIGPGVSTCGLAPGTPAIPTTAPEATWELVGTMAVPSDPDGAGPGVSTADGFRSCFSHNPTGALFAGINWWAQGFNGRSVEAYELLTAATPERDAGLEQGLSDSVTGIGQIAGYRFVDVAENRVVLELAIRRPDGQLASLPTALRWEDGDWKVVLPSTGNPGVGALPDLAGFTPWAGVS